MGRYRCMKELENQKTDRKDNVEGKATELKRGNTYDFRCSKKTFENIRK